MARTVTGERSPATNNTGLRAVAIDVQTGYIFNSYTGSTATTEPIPTAIAVNGAGTLTVKDSQGRVTHWDFAASGILSLQVSEIVATSTALSDGAGRSASTTYTAVNAIY
jgi:hypothetical protein